MSNNSSDPRSVKQYLLLDDVMDLVTAEDKIIVRGHMVPKLLALNMVPMYGKAPDKISPVPPEANQYIIDFDYNLPKATLEKVIQDMLAYTPEAEEKIDEESSSNGPTLDDVIQDLVESTPGSWLQEADEEEIDEQSSSEGSTLDEIIQDLKESMPGSWPDEGIVDVKKESGHEGLTQNETETIRAHIRRIPGSWPEEIRED